MVMKSVLISCMLFSLACSAFKVNKPTGSSGGAITCSGYASITWDASAMPPETDTYDLFLYTSDRVVQLAAIVKSFPQDNPPVGFASFYPSTAEGGHGDGFSMSVVAKNKDGKVLEEAFSPMFSMPKCQGIGKDMDDDSDNDWDDSSSHLDSSSTHFTQGETSEEEMRVEKGLLNALDSADSTIESDIVNESGNISTSDSTTNQSSENGSEE